LVAATVAVLVIGGCQSNSALSQEELQTSFPATELGFVEPSPQISCFWDEDCLGPPEEANWNPVAVAQAIEALIALIKQDGGGSQCIGQGGRQELQCLTKQAKSSGIVPPKTPTSPPTPGGPSYEASIKAVVSPGTSTMPGSPVPAQTLLRIYNLGNEPLTVTADVEVVQSGACPFNGGTIASGKAVNGVEVSPSDAGPVTLPPGMVLTQPLAIDVEDSVPIGQYQVCAMSTGVAASSAVTETVGSNATGTLTVTNVPLRIDQSKMPTDVVPGTPDIEGTITITNLSPAKYSGITVLQKFNPGTDVTVKKASMENANCTIDTQNSSVTCLLPSMDKDDSNDLDLTFDSDPGWGGDLNSSVTVTVTGNVGSANVLKIGTATSSSAGTNPVGPWIGQSGDIHLTGPNLLTYQNRYLYLVPQTGVLQLRDTASNASVWSPNPSSSGGQDVWAQMQTDGNFVVYGEPSPPYNPTVLWSTGTSGGSDTVVATLGTAYTPDGATAIDSGVNFYVFDVTNGTVLFDSAGTPVPFAALIK
jgi:hypothetical protein